jgi:GTPase SAR1 family protein
MGAELAKGQLQLAGTAVEVHIWDVAGEQKYRSLISVYYRDANGVMFVFDLTS